MPHLKIWNWVHIFNYLQNGVKMQLPPPFPPEFHNVSPELQEFLPVNLFCEILLKSFFICENISVVTWYTVCHHNTIFALCAIIRRVTKR